MVFDQAAISALFSALVSTGKQIGTFRSSVIQHEPLSAPVTVPALALWWTSIAPARGASGLAATSARVEFGGRIYAGRLTKPEDNVDPALVTYTSQVIAAFSGGFTLNGEVMEVDLLGAYGAPLSAEAGYLEQDSSPFRVAQLVVPVIADGIWTQGA